MRLFEGLPRRKIVPGCRVRKLLPEFLADMGRKLGDAEEFQVIGVEKRLGLRNREPVLHDVEQEVSASTDA